MKTESTKKPFATKLGEFIAYTVMAVALLVFLAVALSFTYFIVSWAFGGR